MLSRKSIHTYSIAYYIKLLKDNVHARLSNLPLCAELTRDRVPLSIDVGRFLSFTGEE